MLDHVPPTQTRSPYKLLDYFVEADAEVFGGREQEIFEITARLASRGVLVLYGPSGIGKTSLIRAGVFPKVRALGWRYVYVRTLSDPLVDLAAAFAKQLGLETDPAQPSARLVERIAALASKAPVLIALDQFEEFFIRFQSDEALKDTFVEAIGAMVSRDDVDCRVLFSVREDFFAKLDEFRGKLPQILENCYRVGPLSAFGAREAITRPLLRERIPFDNRLVADLLDHLVKFGFDPAILQIICGELMRAAGERNPESLSVTCMDLGALGGIEGIFERYLDNALHEIPPPSHLLTRLVLDTLISKEYTKRAVRIDDLLGEPFAAGPDELITILDTLHKYRIVRRDARGPDDWFELVHERLVSIIQHWIRADINYFTFITARDLVEFASRTPIWRRNPEALLNRGQLEDIIQPHAARLRLRPEKVEFLLLSCIYRGSVVLNYWAGRFGELQTIALLLTALTSENEAMRIGAAVAVCELETAPSSEVLNTCLALSFNDPSERVRRRAGEALGRHGQEREFAVLREALRRGRTRAAALQVYADVLASDRSTPAFGRIAAVRAQYIANHRRLRGYGDFRTQRGRSGVLHGIAAGVAWSLTVGPLCSLLFTLLNSHSDSWLQPLAITMVFIFPSACVLGGILGRSVARSSARRDILSRRANWMLDLLSAWTFWGVVILYIIWIVLALIFEGPPFSARIIDVVVILSSPVVCWIAGLVVTVAIAQTCIGQIRSRAAVISWASATAVVIPAFMAAGEMDGISRFVKVLAREPQTVWYLAIAFTILGTGSALIALSSLILPRLQLPLQKQEHRTPLLSEQLTRAP